MGLAMQNLAELDVRQLKIARPVPYRQIAGSILLFAILAFIIHAFRLYRLDRKLDREFSPRSDSADHNA